MAIEVTVAEVFQRFFMAAVGTAAVIVSAQTIMMARKRGDLVDSIFTENLEEDLDDFEMMLIAEILLLSSGVMHVVAWHLQNRQLLVLADYILVLVTVIPLWIMHRWWRRSY